MTFDEYATLKEILNEIKLVRVLLQRQNEMSLKAQQVLQRWDLDGMPEIMEAK